MARGEMGISLKHYTALGRVAANWAALELSIDMRCWGLAGLSDQMGACLTSQVSGPSRKMDAFCALVSLDKTREAQVIKDAKKLRTKILAAGERRNRIVHDPWFKTDRRYPTVGPHRMEVSARQTLVMTAQSVSTEDVLKLNDQIVELERELYAFASAL